MLTKFAAKVVIFFETAKCFLRKNAHEVSKTL